MSLEHSCKYTDSERPKYSQKTCPSATLSTTNQTWNDQGSNPGLRGEKPGTNRTADNTKTNRTCVLNIQFVSRSATLRLR